MNKNRKQSLGEELANAISHGIGALLSIVGMVLMIIKADSIKVTIGVLIFGISAILLYTMSSLYHAFKKDTTVKRVFRRFDHLSIYLLIGGTYMPIFLTVFDYPTNLIFIIVQWTVIAIGVTLKSAQFKKFKKIHFVLYLILGWSGIAVFKPLWEASSQAFIWILMGGLAYTIGTIFYGLKVKYSHFIWHLFVLAGTILHFLAIYLYLI